MATQELIPHEDSVRAIQKADPLWYSADVVSQRVQLIQQIYRSIMKPETHFGIIPGCKKPSLWKAGSEQLLATFRLAATPEVLDLSTPDCARYRVTVSIVHAPTGNYLGSGIGECSSDELKYKWRASVCKEEYDETPAERRRIKWASGKTGSYSVPQVRQEVADVANTVLKMAKKRAQIDATLTVTAASDIFTQDLEDMEHPVDAEDGAPAGPAPMPQRKSAQVESTKPTAEPERRAESATPPTAGPKGKPCPECGDPLDDDGCHYCGWVPDPPARPAAVQQARQPNPAAKPPAPRTSGRKISEAQAKRFFAIAMGNGVTKPEMKDYLRSEFGIDSDRDLEVGEMYDKAIAWAEGK